MYAYVKIGVKKVTYSIMLMYYFTTVGYKCQLEFLQENIWDFNIYHKTRVITFSVLKEEYESHSLCDWKK